MKKTIGFIFIFLTGGMVSLCLGNSKASAQDINEVVAEAWYDQLVTEKGNSAIFDAGTDTLNIVDIYGALLSIDDKENLYDGEAIANRGQVILSRKGSEYSITLRNGYDIDAADALTDMMAETIISKTGTNATDREKMYALCDYISETFHYDYDLVGKELHRNFVTAYYGNRGIVCDEFSNVTYLVANKLGIDCRYIITNDHAFNIVKLDNDDNYIMCDLTRGRDSFVPAEDATDKSYNIDLSEEVDGATIIDRKIVNTGKTYTPADSFENIRQTAYYFFHGYTPLSTNDYMFIAVIALIAVIISIAAFKTIRAKVRRARRNRERRL